MFCNQAHTSPFFLEEASLESTMRAGLSLLLCLSVSCSLEVRGETKPHDFLPYKKHPLDPDTTADQPNDANADIWTEVRMLRDVVELRNVETERQVDEQKLDLVLTKTSLGEMEERLRASEKQVEELEKVNAELRVNLENQAAELLSIEARVAVSGSELRLLTCKMADVEAQNAAQEAALTSVRDRMKTTECRVDSLIKDSAKVAFYAALTDSQDVGPYNTPKVLKFSKVFTNVGNPYSPTTGFFTAPVKGVYYFSFTICGHTHKGRMGVQLFHNGRSIMFNLQGRYNVHFEYLSNAVVLELNVGDELHLVLPEENAIFDNANNRSTFSGFLLFSVCQSNEIWNNPSN